MLGVTKGFNLSGLDECFVLHGIDHGEVAAFQWIVKLTFSVVGTECVFHSSKGEKGKFRWSGREKGKKMVHSSW